MVGVIFTIRVPLPEPLPQATASPFPLQSSVTECSVHGGKSYVKAPVPESRPSPSAIPYPLAVPHDDTAK